LALLSPLAGAQTLDVMHWWTSASERAAADQLVQTLQQQGVRWQDAAVEGGGGGAAVKVLKSRVLSGSPPAAAQLIGKMLTDWADLGLVLPLNRVAEQGAWQQQFFPEVLNLVTHKGQRIAVPLGIHRINMVLYQSRVFDRLRLSPPRDWSGLERAAQRLRQARWPLCLSRCCCRTPGQSSTPGWCARKTPTLGATPRWKPRSTACAGCARSTVPCRAKRLAGSRACKRLTKGGLAC
jgi:hypothetical protein